MQELTHDERARVEQVNSFLDAMREQCEMGERQVFRTAGISGPICAYLAALHQTPEAVLDFCRDALAPTSAWRKKKDSAP
jgi:hypothetical protein